MSHTALSNEQSSQLQALYDEMRPAGLTPLWEVLASLVTPQPNSPLVVNKWPYAATREHLIRAADLISAAQAQRRVLILENPGLPGACNCSCRARSPPATATPRARFASLWRVRGPSPPSTAKRRSYARSTWS